MKISDLPQALAELEQAARLRVPDDGIERHTMERAFASDFIDAASNDYLGLALASESLAGVSRETEGDGLIRAEMEQAEASRKADAKSPASARPAGFGTTSQRVPRATSGTSLPGGSSESNLPRASAFPSEKHEQRGASFQWQGSHEAHERNSSVERPLNEPSPTSVQPGIAGSEPRALGTSLHTAEVPEGAFQGFSNAATPTVSRGTVSGSRMPGIFGAEDPGEFREHNGETGPSFEPSGTSSNPQDLGRERVGQDAETPQSKEQSLAESYPFPSPSHSAVAGGTVSGSRMPGIFGVEGLGEFREHNGETGPSFEPSGTSSNPQDLGRERVGQDAETPQSKEQRLAESYPFPSPTHSAVAGGTISGSRIPGSFGVEGLGEFREHNGETGPSFEPSGTSSNPQDLGRERVGQDAETPQNNRPSPSESSPPGVSRGTDPESGQAGSLGVRHRREPSGEDRDSDSVRGLVGTSPHESSAATHENSAFPPENGSSSSPGSPSLVSRETEVQGIHDQRALLTSFSSSNLSQEFAEDGESLAFSASQPVFPRTGITVGAGSSRLIFGTSPQHVLLEQELATWVGLPASLLFASGYAANVGALGALLSPEDAVFSDSLNHASLIDGIRLSRARPQVFSHLNLGELEAGLAQSKKAPARWVICEAYYSMDGDAPDLRSLRVLCDQYDAHLYVDEAHSLGTFGPRGAGLCAAHGILPDVMMAAFGKAVGSQGACVAGSQALRTWLWNRARSFVFSTAPSPLLVAATRRQFERTQAADRERVRLESICSEVRRLLSAANVPLVNGSFGPVVGLLMGEEQRALRLAERLRAAGILAQAVRPPTVPPGASRVRLVLRASLSDKQVQRLVEVVAREVAE